MNQKTVGKQIPQNIKGRIRKSRIIPLKLILMTESFIDLNLPVVMISKKLFKPKDSYILSRTDIHTVTFIIIHLSPGLRKRFTVIVAEFNSMITNQNIN
jgi:hypothetical protein